MYQQKQIKHLRLSEEFKTKHMTQLNTYLFSISKTTHLVLGLLLFGMMTVNAQTFNQTYLSNGEVAGQTVQETSNGFSIETTSRTTDNTASFGNITTSKEGQLTGTTDINTVQRTNKGETIKTRDYQFLKAEIDGIKVKLVKENVVGSISWSKEFTIPNISDVYDVRVIQNERQENFLVGLVKDINDDGFGYFVIKTDTEGNILWQQPAEFIGDSISKITSIANIITTQEGGVAFVYRVYVNQFHAALHIVRLKGVNEVQLNQVVTGFTGQVANISVDALADGPNQTTLIAYSYQSNRGPLPRSVTLESLPAYGGLNWRKNINNELPPLDSYPSLVKVGAVKFINNGIIVVGQQDEGVTPYRNLVFTMRFNENGEIEWVNYNYDFEAKANDVAGTFDGGYIVTGSRDNQVWLMKTNSQGRLEAGNNGNCEDINLSVIENNLKISGLTAPIEIVEVYNANWQQVYRCQGGDCGTEQTLTDLANETHHLKITFYTESWEEICRYDKDIEIGGPPPQGCPAAYLIDFGPGFCNDCWAEVAVYEFSGNNYLVYLFDNINCVDGGNNIYDCETGELFCTEGGFTPEPNTCNNFFATATKLETIWSKSNECGTSPSCDNVEVFATAASELQGTVQITGLNAPIEIVKIYDESWNLVYECNADCDNSIIYPADGAGKYIVQVQMYTENWEWICQTDNIEVEVEIDTDCASNLLRDEDGDGVCVGLDCNDNDPNIGAQQPAGTPCDDDDSTTKDDVILSDGCTCKGIPETGNPSCDDVEIITIETFAPTPGIKFYEIIGLTAPIEIVKIFNRNTYEKLYECNNDCGEGFSVELQEGEYVLQIQMYTENWGWICGKDIEFDVTTTDPPTCNFLTEALLDGLCNNCVSEVATYLYNGNTYYAFLADNMFCADAQTIVYSCADGSQFCVDGGLIGSIECAPFFADAQKLQTVWKKSDNCPTCICTQEIVPVCGSDGVTYGNSCLAECAGVFDWTAGECPPTTPDCNNVTAEYLIGIADVYEGIGVENLYAPIEIVKIFDTNWNIVFECNGDCDNTVVYPNPAIGMYRVQVQMYTENWEWICETDYIEVDVIAFDGVSDAGSRADLENIEKEIAVYPNPVQNRLIVQTEILKGRKGEIQIFNTFGQQIEQISTENFDAPKQSIDVSNYQNGLYYMHIKAERMRPVSKKFLVEKME